MKLVQVISIATLMSVSAASSAWWGDSWDSGDGSGWGDGRGYGYGDGRGYGSGYGSGRGDGRGYGDGDMDGDMDGEFNFWMRLSALTKWDSLSPSLSESSESLVCSAIRCWQASCRALLPVEANSYCLPNVDRCSSPSSALATRTCDSCPSLSSLRTPARY